MTRTKAPTVVAIPAACPKCGSTHRSAANKTTSIDIQGEIQGVRYNRITRSYTHCLDCGQVYIIRSYDTEPSAKRT